MITATLIVLCIIVALIGLRYIYLAKKKPQDVFDPTHNDVIE